MEYIQRVQETPSVQSIEGDVNNDNIVDGRDATVVISDYSRSSAGKTSELTESQQRAADTNKDGILDARDATAIISYYALQSVGEARSISEYFASLH